MSARRIRLGLAAVGLVAAAMAAPLVAQDDKEKKDDEGKAKLEKELKDLEGQRSKLDERIGDLRKKLGLPRVFAYSFSGAPHVWSPADKEKFQKQMEEAMKASKKALEEHGVRAFVTPDVKFFGDAGARAFVLPHLAPDGKGSNRLRERLRIAPLLGGDADVRAELKKLREDLNQLRKELGKERKEPEKKDGEKKDPDKKSGEIF